MITTRPAGPRDAEAIARITSRGSNQHKVASTLLKIANSARFPQFVAVDAEDRVLGWVGTNAYRDQACCRGVAEFSLYLDPAVPTDGVRKYLLNALIDAAQAAGFWKLLARLLTFSQTTLAAYRESGFREVGVYEKHRKLDGRWLDVVIVERLIPENLT